MKSEAVMLNSVDWINNSEICIELETAVEKYCEGISNEEVQKVIKVCKDGLYEDITTIEINKLLILALRERIELNPEYSYLAARVLYNELYNDILGCDEFADEFLCCHQTQFAKQIKLGVEQALLDKRLQSFDLERLSKALNPERDRLLKYMGLQMLYDRYILKDAQQNRLETPQYFWMRIAMGLALAEENENQNQVAIEFYNAISTLRFLPSTSPTLFHAGTPHPQTGCYVLSVQDDLQHIFKTISTDAEIASFSAGLGNDWTNVRGNGAWNDSDHTTGQGVIPYLKILDSTISAFKWNGRRHSAACGYLETWHYDIEDFLNLRKNTGDGRRRLDEVKTANWIPDLFMKRVETDGEWTLFSPEEVPELHHLSGQAFEQKYEIYEAKADEGKIRLWKRVRARELWHQMVTMLFETGHPWMTFKDPCNIRSTQDHIGPVCSANLCTEIILNVSPEGIGVTTLGSVNLASHIRDGHLDRSQLAKTVQTGIRMLDNAMEVSQYPSQGVQDYALRNRPIGLGIMGFQEGLYELALDFESEEAVTFSDELMEFIAYYAILASSELAKEKGTYQTFSGSKWDKGLFPIDTIPLLEAERGIPLGLNMRSQLDWTPVRDHVKRYGMRNCNCLAIAPTGTLSNIAGCSPSIEPLFKNIFVKSNACGEFTIINEYLVADLKALNLWSDEMLMKIKHFEGSIAKISEVPDELKEKYKEVFEISSHWIIRHAAHRWKWIDQGQSVNTYTDSESGNFISDLYRTAWRMGLKATYYLRTLGASTIEKSTVDQLGGYDDPTVEANPELFCDGS